MDKTTRKALEGSIRKWERIVAGTGIDKGYDNCPLCHLFFKPPSDIPLCNGCPVSEKTGWSSCGGTPYSAYTNAALRDLESPEAKAAAQAELDFLRSLRPDDSATAATTPKDGD